MQIINRIKEILKLDHKHAKKVVIVLVLAAGTAILSNYFTNDATNGIEVPRPIVTLTTSSEYAGNSTLSVIGTVRAFSEALITTEVAGRVTGVNVDLGQVVHAGAVLATLENASERAALLTAQGVYEAALAAAAQNDVGVDQSATALTSAEDGAVSTFMSAYTTINGTVINSIDTFFSSPDARVPGLKIDGQGLTGELNTERVAYQALLEGWLDKVNTINNDSDLESELKYAKVNVERTIRLIDTFMHLFNNQDNNSRYSDAELLAFSSTYTNLRATLIGTESGIDSALNRLQSALNELVKSELAATGGSVSVADAQVKQAQGSLASAQANLNKTILRTPISGTVNSILIRQGDFVNSFTKVAEVANNNALEIVTYVSDIEKNLLNIGDKVLIEDEFEGIVTQIAPALNSETRKTEVRVATDSSEIDNGDTVRLTKKSTEDNNPNSKIFVPLTAIKFSQEDGFMFTVVDGILVENPVELGRITGGSVQVTKGLTATDQFVLDVRGMVTGEEVEIKK